MDLDSAPKIRPAAAYGRLALLSVCSALLMLAAGYLPTRAAGGPGAVPAMALGLGIALIAALAGLVPPIMYLPAGPRAQVSGILTGMALRFILTLGLLLAALLSRMLPPVALAVWVVIGYLVLVTIDTIGLVWLTRSKARTSP